MTKLHELFGVLQRDFSELVDLVSRNLTDPHSEIQIRETMVVEYEMHLWPQLIQWLQSDMSFPTNLTRFVFGTDCLQLTVELTLADGEVDEEEVVCNGLCIDLFGKQLSTLDRYRSITGKGANHTRPFMQQFMHDKDWFGGSDDCPTNGLAPCLVLALCRIKGEQRILDKYESLHRLLITGLLDAPTDVGEIDVVERTNRLFQRLRSHLASLPLSGKSMSPSGKQRHTVDLWELISTDFTKLVDSVSHVLSNNDMESLTRQMMMKQVACWPEVVKTFRSAHDFPKNIVRLAFASDCLHTMSRILLADGIVEDDEMLVGSSLVKPLGAIIAALDRYEHVTPLTNEHVRHFMEQFIGDKDWFGGHDECPLRCSAIYLVVLVCIVKGDSTLIDAYERVTRTIIDGICQGESNNAEEQNVRNIYENAMRTMREQVTGSRVPLDTKKKERATFGPSTTLHGEQTNKRAVVKPATGAATAWPPRTSAPSDVILDQALKDLDSLLGLDGVKAEIKRLMGFLKVQQERKKHGLRESGQTLHFVFTGNPGTGKTTVARIVGKILHGFGLLKTTSFIEADRSTLVGGFLGQTAMKTDDVINSALDGVLFIDEAYTLAGDAATYGHGDMYGDEAINTLLKRMEDYRDRLIVIVAGYPKPMKKFIQANPGLESRFTRYIQFEDYTVGDLCRIFEKSCLDAEYDLSSAGRAALSVLFTIKCNQRDERFGNARFVRNEFERATSLHSERVSALSPHEITKDILTTLDGRDISFESVKGIDVTGIDFTEAIWTGVCPGCQSRSRGSLKFLGQKVTCKKCGQKFFFPWWSVDPATVRGISTESLTIERIDNRGLVDSARQLPLPVAAASSKAVQQITEIWQPDPQRGAALLEKGVAYLKEGQCDLAIDCFESAISIDWSNSDPAKQPYYLARARAYKMKGEDGPLSALSEYDEGTQSGKLGHYKASIAAYEKSISFDPVFAWAPNNLAWIYATCADTKIRSGSKAIQYAAIACNISNWHCWCFIDTLSAGYAEDGDFDNAVKQAESALKLAPRENQNEVLKNLRLFRERKPLHLDG